MKKIQFGYIAPTDYLDTIPESANFHLILAHLLKDEKYASFYREKSKRGDTIICDNGAFEFKKSMPADELIHLVDESQVNPTYVVAPDFPFEDWEVTYLSTCDFIERIKLQAKSSYKVMAVPQSKPGDWKGWEKGYQKLATHPYVEVIGMSILGIPNAYKSLTGTDDISFNRVFATAKLLKEGKINSHVNHHYLGLGNGPRELLLQRQLGVIDSNDSSSPIWHGHLGILLDNSATSLINGKTSIEVDFSAKKSQYVDSVMQNIKYMEDIILK